MAKKKEEENTTKAREDADLDRIIAAVDELLARQGADESGMYLKGLTRCAASLEYLVGRLPTKDAVKDRTKSRDESEKETAIAAAAD